MLPKDSRIRKEFEYKQVFRNSKKFTTLNFTIYIHSHITRNSKNKVGIIISTEFGKANKRNLLKRWIKAVIKSSDFLNKNNGTWIVIRAKSKYNINLCLQNIKQELQLLY